MKDKRRELRKKHNEICRNIMNETDASDIKKLQAERERIEKRLNRRKVVLVSKTKSARNAISEIVYYVIGVSSTANHM